MKKIIILFSFISLNLVFFTEIAYQNSWYKGENINDFYNLLEFNEDNFYEWETEGDVEIELDKKNGISGNISFKVIEEGPRQGAARSPFIPIEPGVKYKISVWVKQTQGEKEPSRIDILPYTKKDYKAYITEGVQRSPLVLAPNIYKKISFEFITHPESKFIVIRLYPVWSATASGTAWFSKLKLEIMPLVNRFHKPVRSKLFLIDKSSVLKVYFNNRIFIASDGFDVIDMSEAVTEQIEIKGWDLVLRTSMKNKDKLSFIREIGFAGFIEVNLESKIASGITDTYCYYFRIPERFLIGSIYSAWIGKAKFPPKNIEGILTGKESGIILSKIRYLSIKLKDKKKIVLDLDPIGPSVMWGYTGPYADWDLIKEKDFYIMKTEFNRASFGRSQKLKFLIWEGEDDFKIRHPVMYASYYDPFKEILKVSFTQKMIKDFRPIGALSYTEKKGFGWIYLNGLLRNTGRRGFFEEGVILAPKKESIFRALLPDGFYLVSILFGRSSDFVVKSFKEKILISSISNFYNKSLVLHTKDGAIDITILPKKGTVLIHSIVFQALLFDPEDYIFQRNFWISPPFS